MPSSTAFFAALAIGLLITIFGNSFARVVLGFAGADESVLPFAREYAFYIFWGAPFMCASFVLNNDLRAEGKAFFSMIALTTGGIINMVLDPFFIFSELPVFRTGLVIKGLGLGIRGAALCTLLTQFTSFWLLFSFYLR